MKHHFLNWSFFLLLGIGLGLIWPKVSRADFKLSPAKIEIIMGAEEESLRFLTLTNQTSEPTQATVIFENFPPNADSYSLVPYLSSPTQIFNLASGESIQVPILIKLPANPPVGSFHGAVIFSFASENPESTSNLKAVSRLGALFFVRLTGVEAQASGILNKFGLLNGHVIKTDQPPIFYLNYTNSGNVYLNPYGMISLTNRLTGVTLIQTVDPWFVLPESSRTREVTFAEILPGGWYRANLALNRGYADNIDERAISFVVWSWTLIAGFFIGLVILVAVIWFIIKKLKK